MVHAMKATIAIALTLLLAACATTSQVPLSQCDGWSPIYPTTHDVDVISDQLATQVLQHDKHGQAVCKWKQPAKPPLKKVKK